MSIEEFFQTFRIEPTANKYECRCGTSTTQCNIETCKSSFCDKTYCDQRQTGVFYPEITNRILLELICIAGYDGGLILGRIKNVNELKNNILSYLITYRDNYINQVQSLFSEVEE